MFKNVALLIASTRQAGRTIMPAWARILQHEFIAASLAFIFRGFIFKNGVLFQCRDPQQAGRTIMPGGA